MHARDYCVVVAEDDEILRYCTVRLLTGHGYRVIEARDGQHALDLLESCEDRVHLLLTNYQMPYVNGVELARQMRAKDKRLLVLLISGTEPDLDPGDDIEVLPKPYNEALLAAKVRELLRRAEV
jgi:two-component system cell cycle sensor histidine kinase/response regulator CckA